MLKLSIHNRFVILSDGSRFCEPQPKDLRPRSHHHNRSPRSTTEPHLPSANTTTELSSRPKHRGLMRCFGRDDNSVVVLAEGKCGSVVERGERLWWCERGRRSFGCGSQKREPSLRMTNLL